METMWQLALCVFLLPCFTSLTSGADGCNTAGPGNCQFQTVDGKSDWCGWTPGGDFELDSTDQGWYARFKPDKDTGKLTSRKACSTEGQTHCFIFSYRFDVDDAFTLSVSIKSDVDEQNESTLLRVSSGSGWATASVPIHTNHSFSVIFKAEIRARQNASQNSLHIDVITYEKVSCTLSPTFASPEAIPGTSTQSITRAVSPSTKEKDTQTHGTKTKPTIAFSNDEDNPSEPSNNFALIVGVVVGVIVVVIVAVLLVVLCRQRRHHAQKSNTPTATPDHPQPSLARPQQSNNLSVMRNPQEATESTAQEYAVVNKPRKNKQENPPQSPYEISDHGAEEQFQNTPATDGASNPQKQKQDTPTQSPYEISGHGAEEQYQNAAEAASYMAQDEGQGNNAAHSVPNNPELRITGPGCLYQVPRGDTAAPPKDQGEDYNALDFEGKRQVADKRPAADGRRVVGAGAIYNHLNEGDEETYNEVDRQNRSQILGDEYSHI